MKVPESSKIQHAESSDAVIVRRRHPEADAIEARKLQEVHEARQKSVRNEPGGDTVKVSVGREIGEVLDPQKLQAERNEKKERLKALIGAGQYQVDAALLVPKIDEGVNDELAIAALFADKEKVSES